MDIEIIKKQFKVDKNSPIPMYFQIKSLIKDAIDKDIYKLNDQLPTELEFCQALNISRPTIRQAFQELINEGYITRQKAKGTFVSKPKVEGFFFKKLVSYNEEMKDLGLTPSTNVMTQELTIPDNKVLKNLQLNHDNPVLHLERLRYADEEPMVYVHTYVPSIYFPGIEDEEFAAGKQSLYKLFKTKYNHPIAYVDRTIEASNSNKKLADLLNIKKNDAIYTITTIAYDADDKPIEYSVAYYRGDRNRFSIRLVQQ